MLFFDLWITLELNQDDRNSETEVLSVKHDVTLSLNISPGVLLPVSRWKFNYDSFQQPWIFDAIFFNFKTDLLFLLNHFFSFKLVSEFR